jgi:hypothetical protein
MKVNTAKAIPTFFEGPNRFAQTLALIGTAPLVAQRLEAKDLERKYDPCRRGGI